MHILGIANGSINGNSEILLKVALTTATKGDPSITTSWIHAPSVSIPKNPKPLQGTQDISLGQTTSLVQSGAINHRGPDDRKAVLDAIMDADALIFSTPVYSHQPPGILKALTDRVLGPYADAAFATRAIEAQKAGDAEFAHVQIDTRLLKPRVVGFIAVAGSTTNDQVTMALPTLHQLVYSLHAKVVDQYVFTGYGNPGAVAVDETAVERARKLGENVASQLGKSFDDAEYLGTDHEGSCPYCHLSKIEVDYTRENDVGCITCGARGKLVVKDDGRIRPVWEADSDVSCITMKGKLKHLDDIVASGVGEADKMDLIKEKRRMWTEVEVPLVQLPSNLTSS